MEHVHPSVQWFAANAYVLLPLFLGLVAGLCLLVTTIRGTLTAGTAAGLGGLGGVVVLGTIAMAGMHHRAAREGSEAARQAEIAAAVASTLRGMPAPAASMPPG